MTTRRVVVCLDMKAGRVVKGTQFKDLKDMGDPVELATRYEREGADELVFLDVSASEEERAPLWAIARKTAEVLFVPLTIGGGIGKVDDVTHALRSGADKVAMNSAAIRTPSLITDAAKAVGAQCVVVSIDAKREGDSWRVYSHGGKRATDLDAIAWAKKAVELGAGEVLLTSIDRDGARTGYDLALTKAVADTVSVPVVASGGAGKPDDLADAFTKGHAEAALVAGIVHDGTTTVGAIKRRLAELGLEVRA
ncbi:MAG TPA: imidazole glycerol phosphate synthase subunit HisF [Polyangiaceae bacterium]